MVSQQEGIELKLSNNIFLRLRHLLYFAMLCQSQTRTKVYWCLWTMQYNCTANTSAILCHCVNALINYSFDNDIGWFFMFTQFVNGCFRKPLSAHTRYLSQLSETLSPHFLSVRVPGIWPDRRSITMSEHLKVRTEISSRSHGYSSV